MGFTSHVGWAELAKPIESCLPMMGFTPFSPSYESLRSPSSRTVAFAMGFTTFSPSYEPGSIFCHAPRDALLACAPATNEVQPRFESR